MKKKLLKDLPFIEAGAVIESLDHRDHFDIDNHTTLLELDPVVLNELCRFMSILWDDPEWFEEVPEKVEDKTLPDRWHPVFSDGFLYTIQNNVVWDKRMYDYDEDYKFGNVFPTKEDAEEVRRMWKYIAFLYHYEITDLYDLHAMISGRYELNDEQMDLEQKIFELCKNG